MFNLSHMLNIFNTLDYTSLIVICYITDYIKCRVIIFIHAGNDSQYRNSSIYTSNSFLQCTCILARKLFVLFSVYFISHNTLISIETELGYSLHIICVANFAAKVNYSIHCNWRNAYCYYKKCSGCTCKYTNKQTITSITPPSNMCYCDQWQNRLQIKR
jgi:hypothetical protein